jgi:hypothetical protein
MTNKNNVSTPKKKPEKIELIQQYLENHSPNRSPSSKNKSLTVRKRADAQQA